MIWLSVFFVAVEPISAVMLAVLMLWYRTSTIFGLWVRVCAALLAAGLIMHAIGSLILVTDFRPPRTLAWVPMQLAVNILVWTFFISEARHRFDGWLLIFWDFDQLRDQVHRARKKHAKHVGE